MDHNKGIYVLEWGGGEVVANDIVNKSINLNELFFR